MSNIEGSGITDILRKVKNTISSIVSQPSQTISQVIPSLDKYTSNVKQMLSRYGNLKIIQLAVEKQPVNDYVMTLANMLSNFELKDIMEKNGIDKFYHLSLKAEVLDYQGIIQTLLIEKNENINIEMWTQKPNMNILNVDLGNEEFTLNGMLERTRLLVGNKQYFEYNFLTANCGDFCINILKANKVYQDKYEAFLFQDTGLIASKMSKGSKSRMKIITKLGSLVGQVRGKGLQQKQIKFI